MFAAAIEPGDDATSGAVNGGAGGLGASAVTVPMAHRAVLSYEVPDGYPS